MSFQVVMASKSLAACFTAEWLLLGVDQEMGFQVVFPRKHMVTFPTRKLSVRSGDDIVIIVVVCGEGRSVNERLTTHIWHHL